MNRRLFVKNLGISLLLTTTGVLLFGFRKKIKICFNPDFSKLDKNYLFDLIKEKIEKKLGKGSYDCIYQEEEAEPDTQDQKFDYVQVYKDKKKYKDRKHLLYLLDVYKEHIKSEGFTGKFYLCLVETKEITFDDLS